MCMWRDGTDGCWGLPHKMPRANDGRETLHGGGWLEERIGRTLTDWSYIGQCIIRGLHACVHDCMLRCDWRPLTHKGSGQLD